MSLNKISIFISSPVTNLKLLYLLSLASAQAWLPFFNLYLKDKGMTGRQLGLISSLIWIVMLIFQPVWGVFADKFGRIFCYRISVIVTAILLLLFGIIGNSTLTIVICTIFCSLFFIAVVPLLDTLVLDHIESNSKLNYGELRFWGAVGASIGVQITGWVVSENSINFIFITAAILLFFSIPLVFRLKEETNRINGIMIEYKDLKSLFKNKLLVIFLIVITIVSIGQSSIWNYLTVYLKDIGASNQLTSTALMVQGISELPFYFLAALSFKYFGLRNTFLISLFGTVIRLFCYSINSVPGYTLFIELFNGISWTLFWVSSIEYVNRIVKPEWRATGLSLLSAAYLGAGQIIGNNWVGRLYERMSMHKVYAINGGMVFIAMIFTIVIFLIWRDKSVAIYSMKADKL